MAYGWPLFQKVVKNIQIRDKEDARCRLKILNFCCPA